MMNKKRIFAIVVALLITLLVSIGSSVLLTGQTKYEIVNLKNNWTISIDGTAYEDADITKVYALSSRELTRGDELVMTTTLPSIGFLPFPAIIFKSKYTTLECYLDGELIYEFGKDLYSNGDFIGRMYHVISIPREYSEKELTFKMIISEVDPALNYEAPMLGNQMDVEGTLIHRNLIIIATGIYLFLFGVLFLLVSIIFASTIPDIKVQLVEAVFCMNLGAWLLSYFNMFTLFYYTPYETLIEYFTLYLIVPYCYIIMLFIQQLQKKRIYYTIVLINCGAIALIYILQYVFNVHLRVFLPIYHMLCIFGYGVTLYFFIKSIRNKDMTSSSFIQLSGVVVFETALFVHFIIYVIEKLHIDVLVPFGRVIIAFGCIFFSMSMVANYLVYITQTYAHKKEYASLSHLAYADGLTNLPNRARSDKLLKELEKENGDYCIISIDLNGLKIVNDKFGHPTGDRYIKDFAKVLTNTFGDEFCARIGGDEFLVIIKDSMGKDIATMVDRMNSALNVMNAIYSEYHRSVSTGFAYHHEVKQGGSHEVYLLADERMYENKRIMHEQLGIHARL